MKYFGSFSSVLHSLIRNVNQLRFAVVALALFASHQHSYSQACTPVPSGLISWWTGDQLANDYNSINNGTLQNGTTNTTGFVGPAFTFDGANDYVALGQSPSLNVGAGTGFTIECWINPDNTNFEQVIAEWNNGAGNYGVHLFHSIQTYGGLGSIFANIVDAAGPEHYFATPPGVLTPGVFQHVALTYDRNSGEAKIYLNGVMTGSGTVGSYVAQTGYPLYLGTRISGNGAGHYFEGQIDEVTLYDHALSDSEIQAIYNADNAGKCPELPPVIRAQPHNQNVIAGTLVAFSVSMSGALPLSYQWNFNDNVIENATNALLTLQNVGPGNAGNYSVTISNLFGITNSSTASLSIMDAPSCVLVPTNLVSWWAAEGNALDSANTNNGTLQGGATYSTNAGRISFNLNAATSGVKVPASTSLDIGAGNAYTVEAWINPSTTAGAHPIFEWNSGSFGICLWIGDWGPGVGAGYLYTDIKDSSDHPFFSAPGIVTTGDYQHVALTYDKTTGDAIIYLNGANVAQQNVGNVRGLTTGDFWIGYRPFDGGAGSHFVGEIDNVSIYNRALTQTEIQAIYSADATGKCPMPPKIVVQPKDNTAFENASVTLTAAATGSPLLAYQWRLGGVNVPGATGSNLTFTNAQITNSGVYSVVITNVAGSITSSNAQLTVTPFPPCNPSGNGLVSWWRAESNSLDSVGGADGILWNGATFGLGMVGTAFNLDGVNDHVRVADRASLHVTNGLTLEAWVNPSAHQATHVIMSKWDVSSFSKQKSYELAVTAQGIAFLNVCADGGDVVPGSIATTNSLPLNQWTHLCATYDGAFLKIYRDGQFQNQSAFPYGIFPGTNDFGIGGRVGGGMQGGANFPFAGRIDEPTLYNRALTPTEILSVYNAGPSGNCFSPLPPTLSVQPTNRAIAPLSNTTFVVQARGTSPFTYQWRFEGNNITNATNATFTLTNVLPSNGGNYSVAVSNAFGFAISSNAFLKVNVLAAFGNSTPLTNSAYFFNTNVVIQLQNYFTNGSIFYTLDGSSPSFLAPQYTVPFVVTQSVTLRAIGYSADFFQSGELDAVAVMIPPLYPLTMTSGGGGTVSANPTPSPYFSNSVVTITATPNAGWTFLQWLGDASGSNPSTNIVITRSKSVKAVFGTTLGTTASGGGSVALNPPGGKYPYGATVQLTAIPNTGNFFGVWGNAASGNVNPLTFVVTNANPTVSSLFAAVPGGQVALTVVPINSGTVSVSPRANAYSTGSSVTVTATPDAGQTFVGWSGDASGTQNPLPLTLSASKLIYANFTKSVRLAIETPISRIPTEGVQLSITGTINDRYQLDTSTNIPQWSPLAVLTNYGGTTMFTDTSATNAVRVFYRSSILP